MSESLSLDRRSKRIALVAVKKRRKGELRQAAARVAAARLEASDESVAPAAQRLGILDAEGKTVLGGRLVRDGISFRVASPVVRLCQMGARRGDGATINREHVRAAERLRRAWEMSQTVTHGVSSYGDGGGGCVQSGVLSQTVLNSVGAQIDAAREVEGCRRALGILWGVVHAVGLEGWSVGSWALRAGGIDDGAAAGYLRAGLDVLILHWAGVDAPKYRVPHTSSEIGHG